MIKASRYHNRPTTYLKMNSNSFSILSCLFAFSIFVFGCRSLLAFSVSDIDPDSSSTLCGQPSPGQLDVQVIAAAFLDEYGVEAEKLCQRLAEKRWSYFTDVSPKHLKEMMEAQQEEMQFSKSTWENVHRLNSTCLKDPMIQRQFKKLSVIGLAALDDAKFEEASSLFFSMLENLSNGKICQYDSRNDTSPKCDLILDPDVHKIMESSSDSDELLFTWLSWHETVGSLNKNLYALILPYLSEAAHLNGFENWGELWKARYETDDLEGTVIRLWEEIRPLYEQLHAYVRRKLIEKFPDVGIKPQGPIPAHLLGSLFATSWRNLINITLPYPDNHPEDFRNLLKNKDFTPIRMFKLAESFYTSLGMEPMTKEFWEHSLLQKPTDHNVVCHPSSWDFCDGRDFRIKQCTEITHEHLAIAHKEMGRVEYFMHYASLPFIFREGVNPAFQEAIGQTIALSVRNPQHLQHIGILSNLTNNNETDINFLLEEALEIVAALPFSFLTDLWRWKVFAGDIDPQEFNRQWWKFRLQTQGISSPVSVTEDQFQLGSLYHVVTNVEYIKYFLSSFLQYQLHANLCSVAGHVGPLHRCDIYGSEEAGKLIKEALRLGSSWPWPVIMNIVTGGKMEAFDSQPLLDYFEPLYEWLKKINENEYIGWKTES